MSFGFDVGNVRRTRSYAGENTGGFAPTAGRITTAGAQPPTVNVRATFDSGTYTLVASVNDDRAILRDVKTEDLAEAIAQATQRLTEAALDGASDKHKQRDSSPFGLGLGAPRGSRHNLRFS